MSSYPPAADFDRLSTAEKILRLQDEWDRIARRPEDVEVTGAQKEELDRRLEAMESNPDGGSSWEETMDEVRSGR